MTAGKPINLTPHPIVLLDASGGRESYAPSGLSLRIEVETVARGETDAGIPVNEVRPRIGAREEALDIVRGELASGADCVVVSGLALDWIAPLLSADEVYRVLAPDTSPGSAVRDSRGRIEGVRALRIAT